MTSGERRHPGDEWYAEEPHEVAGVEDRVPQAGAQKTTEDNLPVHSFQTLLADLATITKNHVVAEATGLEFDRTTRPTPGQSRALELLQVSL